MEFLLVKTLQCISAGNVDELRLLLNACDESQREELILKENDDVLHLKRPSSSNPIHVNKANALVLSLTGWFVDIADCICSYGYGINDSVDVWDPINEYEPANYRSKPLIIASMLGKLDMVKSLVSNGADVDVTSSLGDTSLLEACYEGNYAVTEYLVQKRASVNKQNERGLSGKYNIHCSKDFVSIQYRTTITY